MRCALLCALAACGEAVDVEPVGDYTAWKRVDITGNAPGHSNSYRIIYANDVALQPVLPPDLAYPLGSILVKEVRADDDGQPGALRYVAIMRKLRTVDTALADEGGWLYTETDGPTGPEQTFGFCWSRCHVAAPYNGAWYDYRQ